MQTKDYSAETLEAVSFPVFLEGAYDRPGGVSSFRFSEDMKRGIYELVIRFEEPEHNQLIIFCIDGRPVDALGIPFWGDSDDNWPESRRDRVNGERLEFTRGVKNRYGLARLYEKRRANRTVWEIASKFAITAEGACRFTLLNANGDRCGPNFYKGDGVNILEVKVLKAPLGAPDTFRRRNPGLPMLDAWGWMAYLDFDNPSGKEETFSHLVDEAVGRACKWGANLLELNPVLRDGHCIDAEGSVPDAARSRSVNWTSDRLRELFTLCHERGLLVELFIFSLGGLACLYDLTSEQIMDFYAHVSRMMGCGSSRKDTAAAIDGVIYEIFPHDAPRETDEAWLSNPGLALAVSGGITGTAMELKNNGFSAAFTNYTAHWVGWPAHQTGYDCLFPAVPYPKDFYAREGEISFSYLQGSAESHRRFEDSMVRAGYAGKGFPGRTAAPDWIFAQLQAFAQRRWRDEDDTVASALCWEAVGDDICPESTKRAVYAASQDPIRSCLTGELKDTGRGGTIDVKRLAKRQPEEELARLLPRHDYPHTCRFLRNQDLEILFFPDRDYNVMQLDLTRSARFYGNGCLVKAFDPFFCTAAGDDSIMDLSESYRVVEAGGSLATTEQAFDVRGRTCRHHEIRRLRILTDVPGTHLHVCRSAARGAAPARVDNVMVFNGNYRTSHRTTTCGRLVVELQDPAGVLPDAVVRVDCRGTIVADLHLEGRIAFNTPLSESHALDLYVLFSAGHLAGCGLSTLVQLADSLFEVEERPLRGPGEIVEFDRVTHTPHTAVAALSGSLTGAVRVRENNWWHYRGVTESDEFPEKNFVGIHRHTNDTVAVAEARFPIGGELTWGWGAQYHLLLSDVSGCEDWFSAKIKVCGTTPFIFAPRVRLGDFPARMTINGRQWIYADGKDVFLPNVPGEYLLAWTYGDIAEPRLCRTFASVNRCETDGKNVFLDISPPPHVVKDLGHHQYYALIDFGTCRKTVQVALGESRIGRDGRFEVS